MQWLKILCLTLVFALAGCKEISNPGAILNPTGVSLTAKRASDQITVNFKSGAQAVSRAQLIVTSKPLVEVASGCVRVDANNAKCEFDLSANTTSFWIFKAPNPLTCSADWYEGSSYRGPIICTKAP
jgi:hypothetical protein